MPSPKYFMKLHSTWFVAFKVAKQQTKQTNKQYF